MRYVLLSLIIFFSVQLYGQTTWYSYQDGNWNDPANWTTDGSAFPLYVNPSDLLPAIGDDVVISNGKQITINSGVNNQRTTEEGGDDDESIDLASLEVIGSLHLTNSTGHVFTSIIGTGSISLEGDGGNDVNFPSYSTNLFFDDEGGTLILQGTGLDLDQTETYGNITVNMTASDDIVTLLNDVTIDGNLVLTQGVFQFNDATDNVYQDLTVNGNVVVSASSAMTVGLGDPNDSGNRDNGYGNYHQYFHVFTVGGSFLNNGSITFHNIIAGVPDYNTRTDRGAVSLVFNDASDQTFYCNSTTDLYYLVIDKGTDQTYSLTINSTNIANFALFGDNDQDWDDTDAKNPEMRKALWINAGELVLEGYIYIPSLTEGGVDYSIGENASMVLNSQYVEVWTTASQANGNTTLWPNSDFTGLSHGTPNGISENTFDEGIYIFGSLKVNDGIFSTNDTYGMFYRAEADNARLEVNGGTLLLDQFRISSAASAATAKMSYIQTGGEVYLKKFLSAPAIFDMSAQLGTFTMSGGEIIIEDVSSGDPASIEIDCDPSNIQVTGGTVRINNTDDNTISSTAPFYNLILDAAGTITMNNDLEVLNSLTLNAGTLDMANFDLTIAKDFTIDASVVALNNLNNVTFNGSANSRIFNNLDASITIPGDLIINKSDETKSLTLETNDDSDDSFIVSGQLNVSEGNFDYDFQTVTASDIYLADTIGTTSSTGSINLTGGAAISSDDGLIHNLSSTSGTTLSGDMTIDGTLTLTTSVFDIGSSKLTIAPSGSITGTYSVTNMIQMDGNSSDGGLELYINGDGNYTFPIGTDRVLDGGVTRYTRVELDMAATAGTGYIQFNVADEELSTLAASGGALTYYWRLRQRDFAATTDIVTTMSFYFADSDGDDFNVANNDNYHGGYVLEQSPYSREDLDDECDFTNNILIFNGDLTSDDGVKDFDLLEGSYTAGDVNDFNGTVDVFYSRQDGNWDDNTSWSFTSHAGAAITNGQCCPTASDVVIIGYDGTDNHVMSSNGNDIEAGVLEFNSITSASTKDGNLSRLTVEVDDTFTSSSVSGIGEFHLEADNAGATGSIISTTDLGDFIANANSTFLYDYIAAGAGNGDLTLTPENQYPTLRLYANGANSSATKDDRFVFNADINCENLMIDGNSALYLDQDLNITETMWVGNDADGELILHNGASVVNMTVGDIQFETSNGVTTENINQIYVEAGGTNDLEHLITVSGNISMIPGASADAGADFDLYNGGTANDAILKFSGTGDQTYTRTTTINTPEFYRIEVDMGSDTTSTITIDHDFDLNGATNGATKALQLDNGLLTLEDDNITIDLSTGGSDFDIPSTAGLEIKGGTISLNGTTDLTLNGLLRVDGANASLDLTGEENNIIYGTGGSAKTEVFDGSILVGGQLRRETTSTSGVLTYKQLGGSLAVGINAASVDTRGVFEIANNPGSSFTLSAGSLTVYRDNGASPDVAALFLDPETSSISGTTTLTIGNPSVTPANPITINSSVAIPNLFVEDDVSVTAQLLTQGLTINNDLDIGDVDADANTAIFDANGLDLNIAGDMNNYGTYTANGNTLTFDGSTAQALTGTGSETVYNFTYAGTNTLTLSNDVTVSNDLEISNSTGTIFTGTNTLDVESDAIIEGSLTSTSGNGLRFSGSSDQGLSRLTTGQSSIGILTINNGGNQVTVPDGAGYDFDITESLALTDGVFNIGGNLLEFDEDATITGTFSSSNMIKTNNAFLDNGVRKILPSADNSALLSYVIPIGETLYTPVTLNITDTGTGGSNKFITVRPANEPHPSVTDNTETLAYYWVIKSENIVDMTGDLIFQYVDPTHVPGTSDETLYLPGRLLTSSSTWDKAFAIGDVDDVTNNDITFSLTTETSAEIQGEYTAGETAGLGSVIETVTTTGSGGNFNTSGTWVGNIVPSNGAIVTIAAGATLTMDANNIRFLRTTIDAGATLDMSSSTGQSIGTVSGTGDIRITSSSFPNGDYTSFFSCTGGGIQYDGSTDYAILASIPDIRNVTLLGTNERQLPSNNINICENLTVSGADLINDNNVDLTIGEDVILNSGTMESGISSTWDITDQLDINGGTFTAEFGSIFNIGGNTSFDGGTFNAGSSTLNLSSDLSRTSGSFTSSTSTITFVGTNAQSVSGDFTTANSSDFYNVAINKASNNVTISSDADILNNLDLTDGYFTTNVSDVFRLGLNATYSNASDDSFVTGPLYKTLDNSSNDNFLFPVGVNGFYARAGVENASLSGDWYVHPRAGEVTSGSSGADNDIDDGNSTPINDNGWWDISGPNTATANVILSFEDFIVSADPLDWNDLRVMMYDGTVDNQWEMQGNADGSDDSELTVTGINTSTFASVHEFTLGSISFDNALGAVVALPVELLSFEASVDDNHVILDWVTSSEINNSHFEIQRSKDGIEFQTLSNVDGNGNSNQRIVYHFSDKNPYNGKSFYRLTQVDFDGTENESPTKSVLVNILTEKMKFTIYPNPLGVNESIHVEILTASQEPVQISIFDLNGSRHVNQVVELIDNDSNTVTIDYPLSKGLYIAVIQQGGQTTSKKLAVY